MANEAANWHNISAAFDALIDLPKAQQDEKLAALPDDIVNQVRSLLTASGQTGPLDMRGAALGAAQENTAYTSIPIGSEIGGFYIDSLIGRGGMGEVYKAHRTTGGFEQTVALKVLRPEALTYTQLFERERRLLAGLEHPSIARLIDGGITPDGRPYMAMEYVDGQQIDDWVANTKADLTTRLRLIREICDAVSYAHVRLVIHRDLKPANILVDGNGRARLLDFGVARLLDETLGSGAPTQQIGTPNYAAPEQLRNEPTTVATDVYALGVVAYELLTGSTPWPPSESGLSTVIRRAVESDPPQPSSCVLRTPHGVDAKYLRGDLDAIILKAMRIAPSERYRSAAEFGDDIARHQRLEPVLAREGSTRYMLGRLARRYRVAIGSGVAVALALIVGAGGIAWQARQTAIERDVAQSEARRSESIVRMLTLMFRESATSGGGEQASVKQMLDQTADKLIGTLDTSAQSATLVATLFDLYVNLEDSSAADKLIAKARTKGIGASDPIANAELAMRQASSAAALGRTDEMEPLLNIAETAFKTDPQRYRQEIVELSMARAQWLRRTGKLEDAIALLKSILPVADQVFAENHRDLLTLYNNLLVYMVEANQIDAMLPNIDRAEVVLVRTGQTQSMQGLTITQLKGMRLLRLDKPVQAEAIFLDVATRRRALFGRSAGLSVDLLQLSRAYAARGKYREARDVLIEARPMASEKLSPTAPPTLFMGLGLVEALAETGDISGAVRVLDEVTPLISKMPKPGPPTGLLERSKAVVYLAQGSLDDAKQAAMAAQAIFTNLGPPGVPYLKAMPALMARIDLAIRARAAN